ncbi:TPR repeat region-containing protein [Nocardiopsis sp. LDBS1602]|uniref:TPR repeat region-containing protein n=1 Tax=Nocardiopsis sp. LDBS1602 TaxID=3109597 RepID=UPI002DB71395|nr:hypothetical protein [Nocardiopsis sp. LDBS1602]MEC3895370.1 hypothetical protein [Nocardiopsis sp. LDBS1602]
MERDARSEFLIFIFGVFVDIVRSVTFNGETSTAMEVSSSTGLYSTRSFNLLMNSDPDFNPAAISKLAEDMIELEARILGRAHDLGGTFDESAQAFTDLIQWSITGDYTDDLDTWMDAAASMRFCAAITEEWYDAAKAYKDERLRIINRWNNEAPALAEGLDKAPPMISLMGTKSPAEKAEADLDALKSELEGEEAEAYRTLDSTSLTLGDDLRNGPTPDAVLRLMNGGYITWSYFNITGDEQALPKEFDPEEMAEKVGDAWSLNDPSEMDEEYDEMLAVLSSLGWRAMQAQEIDEIDMSPSEMQFLKDFYDALERQSNGIIYLPSAIQENLDPEDASAALAALGGGLLALSDKSLSIGGSPGGYSDLPESFRNAVEANQENTPIGVDQWEAVRDLLAHTPSDLSGGRGLSVTLSLSVGGFLAGELGGAPADPETRPDGENMTKVLEDILEVSTRNKDANADLISGPNRSDNESVSSDDKDIWYNHPSVDPDDLDELRKTALDHILINDWDDGGEAAGGLTRWIAEDAFSDDPEDNERAGRASADFIDHITDDEERSIRRDGEMVTRFDFLTNVENGDKDDPDLSFTQLNPELAKSLLPIFDAYRHEFGEEGGGASVSYDAERGSFEVGDETSKKFFEIIAGGEEAAVAMVAIAETRVNEEIEELIRLDGDYDAQFAKSKEAGQENWRIQHLIREALENEAASRNMNAEAAKIEAYNRQIEGREAAVALVFSAGNGISGTNPLTDATIGVVLELGENIVKDAATSPIVLDLGTEEEVKAGINSSENVNGLRVGVALLDHYVSSDDYGVTRKDIENSEHLIMGENGIGIRSDISAKDRVDVINEIENIMRNNVDEGQYELFNRYIDAFPVE